MKALFYSLIFLGLFVAAVPLTARAADIKFGGEFRTRYFYDNNLTDAHSSDGKTCRGPDGVPGTTDDTCKDQESFADARFRLKIVATEDIMTGVVLVDFFNGNNGQDVATLNAPSTGTGTGNRILGSDGFGQSLDSVRLKEGYLRISWPAAHLVIGRQAVTLGHSLILDDTADAVTLAIPIGWASLTFMDLFLYNTASGSSNTSAYLADLNIDPTAGFKSSLFMLLLKDRGPNLSFNQSAFFIPCANVPLLSPATCPISDFGDDQATVATVGWSMDQQAASFRWATELDYLTGSIHTSNNPTVVPALNPSERKISLGGMNALGQVGWTGIRFDTLFTGLYATGQKAGNLPPTGDKLNINAISPNFVLGDILVNNDNVSDRDGGNIGGLTATKLAFGWRPDPVFRAELAAIWARLTQEPASNAPRNLGVEWDLNASWQLEPRLLLTGGFGILFPGQGWRTLYSDPQANDNMIKVSTKLSYTF
ncbi:MAG: hypothetical protein HY203_01920 [Nitrospirae bacterium]|nr:hypothetical protein [Nitrospirota bacterium]